MPFAPFVGVNHHGQTILFGCGLVTREDTASYVWLFKTWLFCMYGKYPNAIITDQCRAMQNAISEVLPNSKHRWCLWHIMKKIREKLCGYTEYQSIKVAMKNAVYDSINEDSFEESWSNLVKEYKLEENTWLSSLYEGKQRWVPALLKDTFWVGMSTTQRSESVNAFFDNYVNTHTSLKEFVEQYENALGKKVQKEEEEDAHCLTVRVQTISPFPFEEQFLDVYTLLKGKQFQDQIGLKIGCTRITPGKVVDGIQVLIVLYKVKVGRKQLPRQFNFIVHYNEESNEANCNCRMFESKGIVCAHMIAVWDDKEVVKVPEKYILRRWKRNLLRSHTQVKVCYANWKRKPEWQQYNHMLSFFRVAADRSMHSVDKVAIVVAKIIEAIEIVDKMEVETSPAESSPIDNSPVENFPVENLQETSIHIGDPPKGPRRGRGPSKRKQSTGDLITAKAVAKKEKDALKVAEKSKSSLKVAEKKQKVALKIAEKKLKAMSKPVVKEKKIKPKPAIKEKKVAPKPTVKEQKIAVNPAAKRRKLATVNSLQ